MFYPFWGSDMPNKLKNIIKNAIDYINVAKKINFSTFAKF